MVAALLGVKLSPWVPVEHIASRSVSLRVRPGTLLGVRRFSKEDAHRLR
jgi:hypothetical protein